MHKKRALALFVILQMVVTSMFPAFAYADEMPNAPVVNQYWQPSDAYTVLYVSNRYDAALALIGEWSSKIQINQQMYSALSNEGSGGDFYDLAQKVTSVALSGEPSWASATSNFMSSSLFFINRADVARYTADWESWLWYGQFSNDEILAAKRDFRVVVEGGSLGGGGGVVTGDAVNLTGLILNTQSQESSAYNLNFSSGGVYYTNVRSRYGDGTGTYNATALPGALGFAVPLDKLGFSETEGLWFASWYMSGSTLSFTLYHAADGFTFGESSFAGSSGSNGGGFNTVAGSGRYDYWNLNTTGWLFDGLVWHYSGGVVDRRVGNGSLSFPQLYGNGSPASYAAIGGAVDGGGNGPNNWPEPTTPSPPDPTPNPEPDPNPPDSPTYDPPGFDPPGFSPDVPVTIVPPDNTTAADYTPWLRAILTALNTIIDDLGEHCDHIRVAMRDYLSGFYDALSEDLQAYYDDLTDYLSDLAKWIVSHLNFDIKQPDVNVNVPAYDDSSVIGWLRRIYYKLGGSGSPRPDPIDDTDGALDWWTQFLQWITNALGGLLTDFVGDLGGFLQELIDTFPFSIPWDIVAMLTLLDSQRATPDFTVTIPAQEGWWDDITVRIELSAYNDAMATVRGMVMIWWMYILVMKTDWMMLLFDGANDAIADFVSRLTGKG